MIKGIVRRLVGPLLGRPALQGAFQAMVELGYAGLGIGEGNHPSASGERAAVKAMVPRLTRRATPVIFDVGANVGDYTAMLKELLGNRARIHCFEPGTSAYERLVERLGPAPDVTLHRVALSDRSGRGVLVSAGANSKLGSLHDITGRLESLGLPTSTQEVELATVDAFCAERGIESVDFMKLDVEGHELNVLRGARRMLTERRIGALQFEFGGANLDSRTYIRDFFEVLTPQYTIYRVLRRGLYPIPRYRETLEVFKRATNYVALLTEDDGT